MSSLVIFAKKKVVYLFYYKNIAIYIFVCVYVCVCTENTFILEDSMLL